MVRIITDTASDINITKAAKQDIELIPIKVSFKDAEYEQLADQDFGVFYSLLEQSRELPTTSMPAPGDYLPHFLKAKAAGDSVVVICLSGGLSGTAQSARLAKEMAEYDEIYVVDSLQVTLGQQLLVDYALKLREAGIAAREIADIITAAGQRVVLYGALDTLKYLRKGGRIPKSTELIGAALGIRPIVTIDDEGKVAMAGKSRGRAGLVTNMLHLVESAGPMDPAMPMYFGYTMHDVAARSFRKLVMQKLHLKEAPLVPVGPIIGTHVGPDCFAAAWLSKA